MTTEEMRARMDALELRVRELENRPHVYLRPPAMGNHSHGIVEQHNHDCALIEGGCSSWWPGAHT